MGGALGETLFRLDQGAADIAKPKLEAGGARVCRSMVCKPLIGERRERLLRLTELRQLFLFGLIEPVGIIECR